MNLIEKISRCVVHLLILVSVYKETTSAVLAVSEEAAQQITQ